MNDARGAASDGGGGMTVSRPAEFPKSPLWLRPVPLLAVVALPSAAATYWLSQGAFLEAWQEPKFFTRGDFAWCLTFVALFSVSIALASSITLFRSRQLIGGDAAPRDVREELPLDILVKLFRVLFWTTIVGYCIWTVVAIRRGVRLGNILALIGRSGDSVNNLKHQLTSVSGLTTVVGVGIGAAIVGSYILFVHKDTSVKRRMWVLICLSAIRALLNSERLALVEIVVPIVIIWVMARLIASQNIRRTRRRLILGPLLAPLVLLSYFAVSEYFRSYAYYSQFEQTSLASYSITRLEGYYIVSYNDGALLEDHYVRAHELPYFTIEAFWRTPIISSVLRYQNLAGVDPTTEEAAIYTQFANPNFNNPGGIMVIELDYGAKIGAIFTVLFGWGIGKIWLSWRRGRAAE